MQYSKFEIKEYEDHWQVLFEGTRKDDTGIGGTWKSGGNFADMFLIGDHYVLQNPFKMKPFAVVHSMDEVKEFLNQLIKNGKKPEIKHTNSNRTTKTEAASGNIVAAINGVFRD